MRVDGKSISELVDYHHGTKEFFDHLNLNEHDSNVARRILIEINSRIRFLIDVVGISDFKPAQQLAVG